jgi:hypothetical protein
MHVFVLAYEVADIAQDVRGRIRDRLHQGRALDTAWVCALALTITRRGRLVPAIDGLSYESEQGMR